MLKRTAIVGLLVVALLGGCKASHQCTMTSGDGGSPVVVPCHHGGNPT